MRLPEGVTRVERPLAPFDDIIDGYFPLCVSLRHMLDRLGVPEAAVILSHAPIMDIPGLPPTAPVPLRLPEGRVGLIHNISLHVTVSGAATQLSGCGNWTWQDGRAAQQLDPWTRLAEPAYVTGFVWSGVGRGTKNARCIALAPHTDIGRIEVIAGPFAKDMGIRASRGSLERPSWCIAAPRPT